MVDAATLPEICSYQAFGETKKQVYLFSLPGGLPPPRPPGFGGFGGRQPPNPGVWGAGAPQGAKLNIKCRPKASYVLYAILA